VFPDWKRWLEFTRKAAWALLLFSLPITSFPHFPGFMGLSTAVVRPLALYPLILLILLEILPSFLRRDPLPAGAGPLIAFCVAALASTAFSLVTPAFPLAGQTPLSRSLRGYLTLGMGVAFLMAAWRMSVRENSFRFAARWLLAGGFIAMLWGGLQAFRLLMGWPGYEQMNSFQRLISVRDMQLLRVNGLAFEPSWHADYLVVLIIPLLLAALATGEHPFGGERSGRWVTGGLSVLAVVNLLFTYSRGGIVVGFGVTIFLSLLELVRRRNEVKIMRSSEKAGDPHQLGRRERFLRTLIVLLVVALAVVGVSYLLSKNYYFGILVTRLNRIGNLQNYLISIGSGPRLALWQAAWGVFMDNPYLGVGLGQSGFWMWDHLPLWTFNYQSEIMETFAFSSMGYPNPKNVWVRLLAETGILGTTLFLLFVLLVVLLALRAYWQKDRRSRFLGLFGILSMAAIVVEGFSLDSFANPTLWLTSGILLGSLSMPGNAKREARQDD